MHHNCSNVFKVIGNRLQPRHLQERHWPTCHLHLPILPPSHSGLFVHSRLGVRVCLYILTDLTPSSAKLWLRHVVHVPLPFFQPCFFCLPAPPCLSAAYPYPLFKYHQSTVVAGHTLQTAPPTWANFQFLSMLACLQRSFTFVHPTLLLFNFIPLIIDDFLAMLLAAPPQLMPNISPLPCHPTAR